MFTWFKSWIKLVRSTNSDLRKAEQRFWSLRRRPQHRCTYRSWMLNHSPRAVFATYKCSSKLKWSWAKIKCRIIEACQPNSITEAMRRPLLMFFLQKLNEAENVDGKSRPEPLLLRNRSWINYQCWFANWKTEINVFFALYLTVEAWRSTGIDACQARNKCWLKFFWWR